MRLGDKTKAIDEPLHHDLRFLDAFGNLDFLFARQQRHLAHLLEIHPHRVIEDVELRFRFFFFFFLGVLLSVFVTVDLGRFDDVDLHPPEPGQDSIELVGVADIGRQRFVQIIEGEIALLLRQLDQLANARLHIGARGWWRHLFGRIRVGAIECLG